MYKKYIVKTLKTSFFPEKGNKANLRLCYVIFIENNRLTRNIIITFFVDSNLIYNLSSTQFYVQISEHTTYS
jgi:hypothetical protein